MTTTTTTMNDIVNPLAGTRWAPLFANNPHAEDETLQLDGVTVRRVGAYKPPEEVLVPLEARIFLFKPTYRFEVSRPLLFPDQPDVWWDREESTVAFDAPEAMLDIGGRSHVEINSSSTWRSGTRALWLGRLLVVAGEIGEALDAQAQAMRQTDRYRAAAAAAIIRKRKAAPPPPPYTEKQEETLQKLRTKLRKQFQQ